MQRFTFETRGKNCNEFNIKCFNHNGFSGVNTEFTEVEVPGRDSPLIVSSNYRKRFELEIEAIIDSSNLATDAMNIKNWLLSDITDSSIKLSNMPNQYFLGFIANKLDIEEVIRQTGGIKFRFNCQPFTKLYTGETVVTLETGGSIVNPTKFIAKPLIKLTSTGDIKFKINSQVVELRGTTGTTYLDCEIMEAYTKNSSNVITYVNRQMYSDFPVLGTGTNTYTLVSGTITSFQITPNWRCV